MYILPKEPGKPQAGYWGYAVANPKPGLTPGPGMLQSADGAAWDVLPPAEVQWGDVSGITAGSQTAPCGPDSVIVLWTL